MSSEEQPVPGFDSFRPEVRQAVEGLCYLGYLEDSFEWCGHSFVIGTLKGDEELAASLVSKEYMDTMGQAKAWVWAQIALSLIEVDGDRNFCPAIGPDPTEYARARFRYATSKWFWPTAEYIFARLAALQERQEVAVEAMRDLSVGGPVTPLASLSSLTDLGISPEELAPEEEFPTPSV